jgi:hypothetical protein
MFGFFGSLTTMDATADRSNRQEFMILRLLKAMIIKVWRPKFLFSPSGRYAFCVLRGHGQNP